MTKDSMSELVCNIARLPSRVVRIIVDDDPSGALEDCGCGKCGTAGTAEVARGLRPERQTAERNYGYLEMLGQSPRTQRIVNFETELLSELLSILVSFLPKPSP